MRQLIEHNLEVVSRRFDVHSSNLAHCTRVLNSMNKLLLKIARQKRAAAQTASTAQKNGGSDGLAVDSSETDSVLPQRTASTHDSTTAANPSSEDSTKGRDSVGDSHFIDLHAPHPLRRVELSPEEEAAKAEEARLQSASDEAFIAEHLGAELLPGGGEIPAYDHAHCSDCSCVYGMANECLMSLAASQHQATECGSRLRRLVSEFKEQLREDAEKLEALDWGGHNHVHLA